MGSTPPGSSTPSTSPTHILQWNTRGIIQKRSEIALKMRENPIPVLAFSEGALPGADTFPGYVKYTAPSLPSFPHGSAALYVHQGIPQSRVDTSSLPLGEYECVAAKVQIGTRTLTVASVYVRAERRGRCEGLLEGLRSLTVGSLLVCGDFNAHHPSWGSTRASKRGREIADEAERTGLCIANTGEHTFLSSTTTSAIDLTLHSADLPVTWRTESDTQGSDHFPIHISICDVSQNNTRTVRIVCWDSFRATLLLETGDPIAAITRALQRATKTIRVPCSFPQPDWQLHNLLAGRKKAQRKYRCTRHNSDKLDRKSVV